MDSKALDFNNENNSPKWVYSKGGFIKCISDAEGYSDEDGSKTATAILRWSTTPSDDLIVGDPKARDCHIFSRFVEGRFKNQYLSRKIISNGTEKSLYQILEELKSNSELRESLIDINSIPFIDAVIIFPSGFENIYFGGEIDIRGREGFLAVIENSKFSSSKTSFYEGSKLNPFNLTIARREINQNIFPFNLNTKEALGSNSIFDLLKNCITLFSVVSKLPDDKRSVARESNRFELPDKKSNIISKITTDLNALSGNGQTLVYPLLINLIPYVTNETW